MRFQMPRGKRPYYGAVIRWRSLEKSEENGAVEGIRTPDPVITNDVLYRLSYNGIIMSRPYYHLFTGGGKVVTP